MLQAPVPHQSSIETKKENLGTDTFQGLLIRGFRVTRTTPRVKLAMTNRLFPRRNRGRPMNTDLKRDTSVTPPRGAVHT